jgi:hypothetical protein
MPTPKRRTEIFVAAKEPTGTSFVSTASSYAHIRRGGVACMMRRSADGRHQGDSFTLVQDKKTAATGKAADARSPSSAAATPTRRPPAKVQGKDRDMGSALRSVYQRTVDEAVPDDLLDLLGKLG